MKETLVLRAYPVKAALLSLFCWVLAVNLGAQAPTVRSSLDCRQNNRENRELAPPAGMVNCDVSLLVGCDGKAVPTWQKFHELIVETCNAADGGGTKNTVPATGASQTAGSCDPESLPAVNWIFRVKQGVIGRHLIADSEVALTGISWIWNGTRYVAVGCRCPRDGTKTIAMALSSSKQELKGFIEDLQVFELVYVPRVSSDQTGEHFDVYTVALVPAWVFKENLFNTATSQPTGYALPAKKSTLAGERDRLEGLFMKRGTSESLREYLERQPRDENGQYSNLQVSFFRHQDTLDRKLGTAGATFFDDCSNFWRTVKERIESQRTILLPEKLRATTRENTPSATAPRGGTGRNTRTRRDR